MRIRELISYDDRLNCKKVNIYNYDSIGSWVLNKIYDYEFDSLNRLISTTYTMDDGRIATQKFMKR